MRVTRNTYNAIVAKYKEYGTVNCIKNLMVEFPQVPEMTLESIIQQIFQRRMEKEYWELCGSVDTYYKRYLDAKSDGKFGIILQMAKEVDLSPALMAHMILKNHYTSLFEQEHPDMNELDKKVLDRKIKTHAKNPLLIKDGHLGAEIQRCHMNDVSYGPIADRIKRSLGEDYEGHLKKILKAKGIAFYTEKHMQGTGFDKTPDIKLTVPIAIGETVINWIESKASFGDFERHKDYLRNQYDEYLKRFGPGLIIYWFGFIDDPIFYADRGLLICDTMPSDITFMDPETIPPEEDTLNKILDTPSIKKMMRSLGYLK